VSQAPQFCWCTVSFDISLCCVDRIECNLSCSLTSELLQSMIAQASLTVLAHTQPTTPKETVGPMYTSRIVNQVRGFVRVLVEGLRQHGAGVDRRLRSALP
jgi:hypothetical protein